MNFIFQSYRDYHADIFPDVSDGTPAMQAPEWFAGHNKPVSTGYAVLYVSSFQSFCAWKWQYFLHDKNELNKIKTQVE